MAKSEEKWRNGKNIETPVLLEGVWTSAVIVQTSLTVPGQTRSCDVHSFLPDQSFKLVYKKTCEAVYCNSICDV